MKIIETILILLFTTILITFGIGMVVIAPEEHRVGYYLFSLLCFSIIGLFYNKGRLFNFFGSLAATIILIAVIFSIAHAVNKNSLPIFNAIMWIIIFAYPSLKFILRTKFGFIEEKIKQKELDEYNQLTKENNE